MIGINELKKLDVFSVLTEKQIEKLTKIAEMKNYKASTHIYEHGDPAKHLFVVINGTVALKELHSDDPVGVAFEMRDPGEIFGAACLMLPQQYTLTAVCMTDARVLAVDAAKLVDASEVDPDMGYRLMKKVAQLYFDRYKLAKRRLFEMAKTPATITALPG